MDELTAKIQKSRDDAHAVVVASQAVIDATTALASANDALIKAKDAAALSRTDALAATQAYVDAPAS